MKGGKTMVKHKKNPSKGAISAADVKGESSPHLEPVKGRHGNNEQYTKKNM